MSVPGVDRLDPVAFGRRTLGPILAEFCLRLWLFERFLPPGEAVLLFCARGGLRLKLAYERFLVQTLLPPYLTHAPLMVSRLVAARTAFDPPSPGVLSELEREFSGQSMAEIAAALAQCDDLALSSSWNAPFERSTFVDLLNSDERGVVKLKASVADQNALFRAHLTACAGEARHCVLVDTGLYGSTLRMLQEGVSDRTWSSLQFARCNYKRLPTPHFARTLGLSVESDWYKPWDARTSALRFWQLIEACLEPDLSSVRTFSEVASGHPLANLQVCGWEDKIKPAQPSLFTGALAYIDGLSPATVHQIPDDAARAWRSLKNAVVWPNEQTIATLSLGGRSRDFGRTELSAQFADSQPTHPIRQIRDSLWREGAVVRSFPQSGRYMLPLIEFAYAGRAVHMEVLTHIRKRRRPVGEACD